VKLTTQVVHVPWRAPLRAAHGGEDAPRALVLVTLTDADGQVGYGEAAPLESYDGVSLDSVLTALSAYVPVLEASAGTGLATSAGPGLTGAAGPGFDHAGILSACMAVHDLPQALAAIDMALWDLAGRRAGQPVWKLLGAERAPSTVINAVIGAVDPVTAAAAATAAVRNGYRCVKVKVGAGDPTGAGDDLARVAAVRAAVGADVAVRIDANGAWGDSHVAAGALASLARFDIELCEEPVHGAYGISAVGALTPMTLAVDESTRDAEVFERRVAQAVCLKISASGGITGVTDDAHRARCLGYEVFLASTLDGPLGIAAALHAAALVVPGRAFGLSTLERFIAPPPFTPTGGVLLPPPGPGLGTGLTDWYGPPDAP
jgi:L-alanine-DL-glutamate epimerase-like enolase superfamily enzyme